MKIACLTLAFVACAAQLAHAQSRTYYVAATGNDANSGRSPRAAWQSLDRVNRAVFQPGDAILFKSGDAWRGQLHPQGSGTSAKPIRIDRFGKGPLPCINFGAATGAGLELSNQEWWQIHNLEITSGAPPEPGVGRAGIAVLVEGPRAFAGHVVIGNCYLHDIWGQLGGAGTYTAYASSGVYAGGLFGRGRTNSFGARMDDIVVENNRIERIDRCGVIIRAHTNVVVRGNYIENLGGDGIMTSGCYGGLIERNIAKRTCMSTGDTNAVLAEGRYNPHSAAIWIINCTNTIMQFNEVYDTGRQQGNGDGEAYDFDFYCTNCLCQFNYSRNNHGLLLIMDKAVGNIARYNISENDQSHLIEMHGLISEGNLVNNNVFYVDYGMADITFYEGMTNIDDAARALMGANFRNNIFYATGQGRFRTVFTYGPALERQYLDDVKLPPPAPATLFQHNWYYGPWLNGLPADPEKMEGDPMFIAPGTGGVGLDTLGGYRLRDNSPCVRTGMAIDNNGVRDFYGNPLNSAAGVSYGVYEPPARRRK